ncbi:hypothetical protein [Deinococcus sonorensis]|uniref:Zn-finger containing protein n=2 Tax=Deinococcus sonorensis TaxID=309891 RepID=A0AAU7UC31_9DEIO
MRFPTRCPHCQTEHQTEYLDSGIHDLICPACRGRYVLFVRKHRFEMLFDLGTRALMGGYAREAVANFAASCERCFEFYLRAVTLERAAGSTLDLDTFGEELDRTWKTVVSQSERQLGAFAFAYLGREGRAPDFLTPRALGTDFRNRVIHRGELPREAEVEAYAARLYALMNRLLAELGDAALHVTLLQERDYARYRETLPPGVPCRFEEHPGMFQLRRFGGTDKGRDAKATPAALNDAAVFQAAMQERGQLVVELFKGRRA